MSSGDHYFSAAPGSASAPRRIQVDLAGMPRQVTTDAGIFSPQHLDTGTRVLLDAVPEPPGTGDVLDLGCGWGPIALSLALLAPRARVWAVDVNERALELTRENAASLGAANLVTALPDDVPDDVTFDTIWSNPPIRIGKEALHALLLRWLPRLRPGGDAWLVVQRNLGSDSLHRWLDETLDDSFRTTREASSKGFRVLRVVRGPEERPVTRP